MAPIITESCWCFFFEEESFAPRPPETDAFAAHGRRTNAHTAQKQLGKPINRVRDAAQATARDQRCPRRQARLTQVTGSEGKI